MVFVHRATSFKRRECSGSPHDRQLATMTVDFEVRAELRDLRQQRPVNRHLSQTRTRARNSLAQLLLVFHARLAKRFRIAIVRLASLYDVYAIIQISLGDDFRVQSKSVQQLRAQFSLFRIAGTDQHEARRMFDGHAFALNSISSCGRNVQQKIDEMVFEKVDLVYVQKAAIGPSQQPGIESLSTLRERAFD